jgi:hypothetical protein
MNKPDIKLTMQARHLLLRHCERSEAIQFCGVGWIASSLRSSQ